MNLHSQGLLYESKSTSMQSTISANDAQRALFAITPWDRDTRWTPLSNVWADDEARVDAVTMTMMRMLCAEYLLFIKCLDLYCPYFQEPIRVWIKNVWMKSKLSL